MLNDDLHALRNVCFMQLHETGNLPFCINGLATRIFFNLLVQLIESVVSGVILKHIKNKPFLNGLLHGVNVECLTLPFGVQSTEQLNRCGLWGGGKSEHGDNNTKLLKTALCK